MMGWLGRHTRFTLHFTPTYSSWLNLVERWFAELTERWLRRGTHRSTKELVAAIRTWTNTCNDDPKPFVWHKTADEILDSLAHYYQRISDSGHKATAEACSPRATAQATQAACPGTPE